MSEEKLRASLTAIGLHEEASETFVDACRAVEEAMARADFDVREEITGPLVDAMYGGVDVVAVTLDDGVRFEVPYRSKIARDLVLRSVERPDHVFEPQTTKTLRYFARGANHVIVGGAYAGDHAIPLAHDLRESGGTVHAFEPNAEQMYWLRRNAETNLLSNLRFESRALWNNDGVRLRLVGDDAYIRTEPDEEFGTIDAVSIEGYSERLGIEKIDLIMLDVEGGELSILQGARRFLAMPAGSAPAIVYEINNAYVDWSRGLHRTEIVEFLAEHGYTSFGIRDYQSNVDMAGRRVELVPVEGAYLGGPRHGFNVLATKKPEALPEETFRIVSGRSPKLLRHRDPALHAPLSEDGERDQ